MRVYAAAAPVPITTVAVGDTTAFSFQTEPGVSYRLQYTATPDPHFADAIFHAAVNTRGYWL